jgi:hypothetical protein
MELIAGIEAASPMSRKPAGSSSGSSNGAEPSETTWMVMPGSACMAHWHAGPVGSCSTTSTANSPICGSAHTIVYARWNWVLPPAGSGNQNRSQAVGPTLTSSNSVGDDIVIRKQCGATREVSSTVARWSRPPKPRSIAPWKPLPMG